MCHGVGVEGTVGHGAGVGGIVHRGVGVGGAVGHGVINGGTVCHGAIIRGVCHRAGVGGAGGCGANGDGVEGIVGHGGTMCYGFDVRRGAGAFIGSTPGGSQATASQVITTWGFLRAMGQCAREGMVQRGEIRVGAQAKAKFGSPDYRIAEHAVVCHPTAGLVCEQVLLRIKPIAAAVSVAITIIKIPLPGVVVARCHFRGGLTSVKKVSEGATVGLYYGHRCEQDFLLVVGGLGWFVVTTFRASG